MPFTSGFTPVPNSAVKICTLGPQGGLLQNLGSVVVTLGGPDVTAGGGPSLPATMTSPLFVPGGLPVESGDVPAGPTLNQDLYGIGASAGPANVAFLTPF